MCKVILFTEQSAPCWLLLLFFLPRPIWSKPSVCADSNIFVLELTPHAGRSCSAEHTNTLGVFWRDQEKYTPCLQVNQCFLNINLKNWSLIIVTLEQYNPFQRHEGEQMNWSDSLVEVAAGANGKMWPIFLFLREVKRSTSLKLFLNNSVCVIKMKCDRVLVQYLQKAVVIFVPINADYPNWPAWTGLILKVDQL